MNDGRYKRLRQYARVYRNCHKRLRHVKTKQEHECLLYVQTMAENRMIDISRSGKNGKDD